MSTRPVQNFSQEALVRISNSYQSECHSTAKFTETVKEKLLEQTERLENQRPGVRFCCIPFPGTSKSLSYYFHNTILPALYMWKYFYAAQREAEKITKKLKPLSIMVTDLGTQAHQRERLTSRDFFNSHVFSSFPSASYGQSFEDRFRKPYLIAFRNYANQINTAYQKLYNFNHNLTKELRMYESQLNSFFKDYFKIYGETLGYVDFRNALDGENSALAEVLPRTVNAEPPRELREAAAYGVHAHIEDYENITTEDFRMERFQELFGALPTLDTSINLDELRSYLEDVLKKNWEHSRRPFAAPTYPPHDDPLFLNTNLQEPSAPAHNEREYALDIQQGASPLTPRITESAETESLLGSEEGRQTLSCARTLIA